MEYKVTLERTVERRDQVAADLAEARRVGHSGWIDTLSRHLDRLAQAIVSKRAGRPWPPPRPGELTGGGR